MLQESYSTQRTLLFRLVLQGTKFSYVFFDLKLSFTNWSVTSSWSLSHNLCWFRTSSLQPSSLLYQLVFECLSSVAWCVAFWLIFSLRRDSYSLATREDLPPAAEWYELPVVVFSSPLLSSILPPAVFSGMRLLQFWAVWLLLFASSLGASFRPLPAWSSHARPLCA